MSTAIHFTSNVVSKLLSQAVALKGKDYKDGVCLNVDGTGDDLAPGCIVGTALNFGGIDLPTLARYDGSILGSTARALKREGLATFTPRALVMLDKAQGEQDTGSTWGEAAKQARAAKVSQAPTWTQDAVKEIAKRK